MLQSSRTLHAVNRGAAIKPLVSLAVVCAAFISINVISSTSRSADLNQAIHGSDVRLAPEFPIFFDDADQVLDEACLECDQLCDPTGQLESRDDLLTWQLLPDGLLWHSYLADPHEPRISAVILGTREEEVFWDATLGGRVGLLRYGTAGANPVSGFQWDLQGAVITRLDLGHAEDVESMDYRFGTDMTMAEGPWAAKFGYFHVSSHVGDEYMIRNPTFQRVNYVTESWIAALSYSPSRSVRIYGEFANAFRTSGGAKRYQFQTGAEFTPASSRSSAGAPFAAIHMNFREAVDYDVSTTIQAGWSYQGPTSGRRLRFGLQYGQGPTSQYAFFTRREEYLAIGTWFDY